MKPVLLLLAAGLLSATAWAGWGPSTDAVEGPDLEVTDAANSASAPVPLEEGAPCPSVHLASAFRLAAPAPVAEHGDETFAVLCDGEAPLPDDEDLPRDPAPKPAEALPLDVLLVDAETGLPSARAIGRLVPADEQADARRHPVGWVPVKEAKVAVALEVTAGPGEVAWDTPRLDASVSRYAERLRVGHPLRREVTTLVSVETADGGAPVGELDVSAWVAGSPVGAPAREVHRDRADAPGRATVQVPGIALLHGERLSITVRETRGDATFTAGWETILGQDRPTRLDAEVVLPAAPDRLPSFLGRGSHRTLRCGCGCRRVREPRETGVLLLGVLRTDGRPAAGAEVLVRSREDGSLASFRRILDARGRALVSGIEEGRWEVALTEVGLVPTTDVVHVAAARTTTHSMREGPGATLEVEVVDEAGHPLPHATVEVRETPSGVEWVDLVGDVERLDPFTDEAGRRTLSRLGRGPTRLRARYGSRSGEQIVDVPPAGIVPVRLIVR